MSTSDHPETDGQTERTNRVLEKILRGDVYSFSNWSKFLPMVELAINMSVHASTTHTPVYVNGLPHPRITAVIQSDSRLRGEGIARAKTVLALAHHVSPLTPIRLMPMSMLSTSTMSTLAVAMTMLLHQTMMTMLDYSASPTIMPARKRTPLLNMIMTSYQCVRSALKETTTSQQKTSC